MKLPGYHKRGNSFWRTEQGFYRLIHLQRGAYGDYYFVNIALHPQGFPLLHRGPLCQPEHPKEHECLLRQRLEGVSERAKTFSDGLGYAPEALEELLTAALPEIESWFDHWGNWETLRKAELEELERLFSVVPILWTKEFHLLKACCATDRAEAEEHRRLYMAQCPDRDFSAVDRWLAEDGPGRMGPGNS